MRRRDGLATRHGAKVPDQLLRNLKMTVGVKLVEQKDGTLGIHLVGSEYAEQRARAARHAFDKRNKALVDAIHRFAPIRILHHVQLLPNAKSLEESLQIPHPVGADGFGEDVLGARRGRRPLVYHGDYLVG